MRQRNPSFLGRRMVEHAIDKLQLVRTQLDRVPGAGSQVRVLGEVVDDLRIVRSEQNPPHRRNPYIVTFGANPPMRRPTDAAKFEGHIPSLVAIGTIAKAVHSIKYEHMDDGAPYEHTFESEVRAVAVEIGPTRQHGVLLFGVDGQPIFEDV